MSTLWKSRYALRTLGIKSSAIRELLKVTQRPEVISFGGGLPAHKFHDCVSGFRASAPLSDITKVNQKR
jgi:hypothetical protein